MRTVFVSMKVAIIDPRRRVSRIRVLLTSLKPSFGSQYLHNEQAQVQCLTSSSFVAILAFQLTESISCYVSD